LQNPRNEEANNYTIKHNRSQFTDNSSRLNKGEQLWVISCCL